MGAPLSRRSSPLNRPSLTASPPEETQAEALPRGAGLVPLAWPLWPAEGRLLLGLVALWCCFGLLVLTSASWFVTEGDPTFYVRRQLI